MIGIRLQIDPDDSEKVWYFPFSPLIRQTHLTRWLRSTTCRLTPDRMIPDVTRLSGFRRRCIAWSDNCPEQIILYRSNSDRYKIICSRECYITVIKADTGGGMLSMWRHDDSLLNNPPSLSKNTRPRFLEVTRFIKREKGSESTACRDYISNVRCAALHCIALHCKLHCTVLHCAALHSALHCTALHCTALHCTALHCTALHCTALHCTALHWTFFFYKYFYLQTTYLNIHTCIQIIHYDKIITGNTEPNLT